jgi:hypothetical protein
MSQYCDLPPDYYKCCNAIYITLCLLLKRFIVGFLNPQQDILASPYTRISSLTHTCLSLHFHYIIRYSCTTIYLSSVRYSYMFTYHEPHIPIPVCPHILSNTSLYVRVPSVIPACPHILSYISLHVRIPSVIHVYPHILSYISLHVRILSVIPVCPHILSYISLHVRIPSVIPVYPHILSYISLHVRIHSVFPICPHILNYIPVHVHILARKHWNYQCANAH